LVICYLEGMDREEAAQRLGCPLGTLKGRLERGKERLRTALERRGLSLSAALAAALVGRETTEAAVPSLLARTTLRTALGTAHAVWDAARRGGFHDGQGGRGCLHHGSGYCRCRRVGQFLEP